MSLPTRRFLPLLCSVSLAAIAVPTSVHAGDTPPALDWPRTAPVYDHVVIVLEENKDYEQIINNAWTPYISSVLCKEGAVFTQMFGEEHSSEGNYFWLFSGSDHRIGFYDQMPQRQIKAPNLGEQLLKNGLSFMGYSENLPMVGSTVVLYPPKPERALYARKHVPWVSFSNLPDSTNQPFTQFPKDATGSNLPPVRGGFADLPTVSFVIPNLINDMHDGAPKDSVPAGDAWLKENIDAYYQWAKRHNSLLVITFDENDNRGHYQGLTNPGVAIQGADSELEFRHSLQNRIPTIFAGAHIKAGEYPEGKGITHVNLLRTFEAMYGLNKSGDQQPNALGIGITNDYIVTDVFQQK